jgi:myo-inositol-1(or 4)-monophosphatase
VTPDLGELRELAAGLARDAGRTIRVGRDTGIADVTTKSSDTDVVTEFDRASEALIVEGIVQARPADGIVGEEGTDRHGDSGIRWLIDPIDGTTNFLYGLPGYAVSIAARNDTGTLVGAVYVPATDELFSAAAGQGATLNGKPIRPSATTAVQQMLVATGFNYLPERRARQAQRVARMIGAVRDIRRFGAAAADLCYVACGRVDAYFEEWLGPWDLAAGELIAREAGCRAGDFTGGPPRPAQVLVTTPQLFDAFVGLLAATEP